MSQPHAARVLPTGQSLILMSNQAQRLGTDPPIHPLLLLPHCLTSSALAHISQDDAGVIQSASFTRSRGGDSTENLFGKWERAAKGKRIKADWTGGIDGHIDGKMEHLSTQEHRERDLWLSGNGKEIIAERTGTAAGLFLDTA